MGENNTETINRLLENSKAAIMGAVELHNKPVFPYRYEISVILTINAWELALKAFILKFRPDVKMFGKDGQSKEFLECIGSVHFKLGNDFLVQKENIELLYKYRCDTIHFYGEGYELILYSLLRPNIIYFSEFLLTHFEIDLANEANLIILPIGFKRSISPIDYLSENSIEGNSTIKEFINSIAKSAQTLEENGFTDGLICNYTMNLENVDKVKNADIIVGITKEPVEGAISINKVLKKGSFTLDANAPKFQIDEESLFKTIFTISHKDFIKIIKEKVGYKENTANFEIIKSEIRSDPNCFKYRYLDAVPTPKSTKKPYYSQEAINKAIQLFKKE